jgi:hypothetical protein
MESQLTFALIIIDLIDTSCTIPARLYLTFVDVDFTMCSTVTMVTRADVCTVVMTAITMVTTWLFVTVIGTDFAM